MRPLPLLALGAVLLAGGGSRSIQASHYDQACSADADCVEGRCALR